MFLLGALICEISTHALREEGDPAAHGSRHQCGISTHALREEGDLLEEPYFVYDLEFLPTPSVRRATGSWSP